MQGASAGGFGVLLEEVTADAPYGNFAAASAPAGGFGVLLEKVRADAPY